MCEQDEARGLSTSRDRKQSFSLSLRTPRLDDGADISALIRDCPPLDTNSAYCGLLLCTHFKETCVVAERAGKMIGWISAYRPPAEPDRIFVWQVAVHASARGTGLGKRMLDELMTRQAVKDVTTLITTITEANNASWALFGSFARRRGAGLQRRPIFQRDVHFAGEHDTEFLVSIRLLTPQLELSAKEAT
ncbi:MAG: diaminobutyrate acetyltransferase [Parvibaculum sp.]|nr:diaminobutyrate acetyltransferase [Parvibaculum sp.]